MLAVIKTVSKRPWLSTVLAASGIAVAVFMAPSPQSSASLVKMLPENHQSVTELRKFQRIYNVGEAIAISYTSSDLFSRQSLNLVRDLASKIEAINGIAGATAITSVQLPNIVGEGVEFTKLVPDDDIMQMTDADLDGIKQKALGNAMIAGHIIGADGKTTGILAETNASVTDAEFRDILAKVQAEVDRLRAGGADLRLMSRGSVEVQVEKLVQAYASRLWMMAGSLAFAWLFIVLGSVSLAALGAGYTAAVTALSVALLGFIRLPIDQVSMITLALVPMITLATLTPLLIVFQRSIARGGTVAEAVQASYLVKQSHLIMLAVSFALVGGTLLSAEFSSIKTTGGVVLGAVAINLVLGIVLLPSMLSLAVKAAPSHQNVAIRNAVKIRIGKLDNVTLATRLGLALITAALLAGSLWKYSQRETETSPLRFLSSDNQIQRDLQYFDAQFGGPEMIDMEATISTEGKNFFSSSVLLTMNKIQAALIQTFPESVTGTISIADYFKELHKAFTPSLVGDAMPTKEEDYKNYGDLLEFSDGKAMGKMLTIDKARARIMVSRRLAGWNIGRMNDFQNKDLPQLANGEIAIKVAGYAKYVQDLDKMAIKEGERQRNLSIAVFMIFVLLVSRSLLVTGVMTFAAFFSIVVPVAILSAVSSPSDIASVSIYSIGLISAFIASLPVLSNYRAKGADAEDSTSKRLWQACVESIPEILATMPLVALVAAALGLSGIGSTSKIGLTGTFMALTASFAFAVIVPMLVSRPIDDQQQNVDGFDNDTTHSRHSGEITQGGEKTTEPSLRAG